MSETNETGAKGLTGLIFVSSLLLYLSHFPVAIGSLAWFALIPFLFFVRLKQRPRRLYALTWLAGLAFYLPVLQWIRVADPMMYFAWIFLACWSAGFWPLALGLTRRIDQETPVPLVISFPTVWVAFEFVRWGLFGCFYGLITGSHVHDLPGGFSWYQLGHTQHDRLEMIQIADITGSYGVSFLVAMVNALLFEVISRRTTWKSALLPSCSRRNLLLQSLLAAILLLGSASYGLWRLSQSEFKAGPRVALIQTNAPQSVRNQAGGLKPGDRDAAIEKLQVAFDELARAAREESPDLIIAPETCLAILWEVYDPPGQFVEQSHRSARELSRDLQTPTLLGLSSLVMNKAGKVLAYNSAFWIDEKGRYRGRYDKIHRVPFGEFIPVKSWLPFLAWFSPYEGEYGAAPGLNFTRFRLKEWTFGVVICYEDTDPAMNRPYVQGEKVDFLVNISNDGWFDGTSEHDEHLAISRFRAIETRRSLVRSVNMGISAIVDPNGRVLEANAKDESEKLVRWEAKEGSSLAVSRWHEFKKRAGIVTGTIPIDERTSVYSQIGDTFAGLCLLLATCGFFWKKSGEKKKIAGTAELS